MSESTALLPGIAYIKTQFLAENKSKDNESLVTETTPATAASEQSTNGEPSVTASAGEKRQAQDSPHDGGNKRKKKRGQNKHRPRLVKEARCNKLCRFLWGMTEQDYKQALEKQEAVDSNGTATIGGNSSTLNGAKAFSDIKDGSSETPVGDASSKTTDSKLSHPLCPYTTCDRSHDVITFLASKLEDLSEKCHNFETFGFCEYGLICRFGSTHIRNGFNLVNEELWSKHKGAGYVTNILPKETQTMLRKRQFLVPKTEAAMKVAQTECDAYKEKNIANKNGNAKVLSDSPVVESVSNKTESVSTLQPASKEHGDIEANADGAATTEDTKSASVPQLASENVTESVTVSDNSSVATDVPMAESKLGPASDEALVRLRPCEKKKIVWRDQLYLAPLTTLGNLPFRRICRRLGADITCGEMAVATCLLQGSPSEWALVKRHHTEKVFGVQLCGSNPHAMVRCCEALTEVAEMDFVDINVGCPIDMIYRQGGGTALMRRQDALQLMVRGMAKVLPCPVTVKMRTAIYQGEKIAHTLIPHCRNWGADIVTLHGRSREQRYTKSADWSYIKECVAAAAPMPLFGNGDVLNYEDYFARKEQTGVEGIMIGRGALMKPWIFTEIKEQRHWDISSSERMDILREFTNNGLEHWGSDTEGIEKTRRFLLEWLSFLNRYIPIGLLERPPQGINQKPPQYIGRDHLETLMASKTSHDWIKISEMLLGSVPSDFKFLPKHRANSWA